ncbi:MAG: LuxR C-terminal-related transcriptional regulator [Burkholderiales bacterium]|nr:LuxR C-terminal-related transcriptional regulator [Burkholderiales bacterium]
MSPEKLPRLVVVIDDDMATFKALTRLGPQGDYVTQAFPSSWVFAQWLDGLGTASVTARPMCLVIDAGALASDVSWYLNEHISLVPKICIGLPATTAPLAHLMNAFEGDFIRKPFTLARISASIDAAFARHALLAESSRHSQALLALFALLSPREQEVAQLVGAGLANLDIAQALGITLKTVKAHRAKVMGKTQSVTIAEFVGKHNQYRDILAKRHHARPTEGGSEVHR